MEILLGEYKAGRAFEYKNALADAGIGASWKEDQDGWMALFVSDKDYQKALAIFNQREAGFERQAELDSEAANIILIFMFLSILGLILLPFVLLLLARHI